MPNPEENKVCLKLLVSNTAAGAIIGKEGANLAKMQDTFSVRVGLSPAGANFPSTSSRVCQIFGEVDDATACLRAVVEQEIEVEGKIEGKKSPKSSVEVNLVVPSQCVGSLIGKKGAGIQDIAQKSGCFVRVATETATPSEVLCPVNGPLDNVLVAARLILECLREEPRYSAETQRRLTYPLVPRGHGSRTSRGRLPKQQAELDAVYRLWERMAANDTLLATRTRVNLPIPSAKAGLVIGKGGRRVADIRQASGASVSVHNLEESEESIVEISGSLPAIFTALTTVAECLDATPSSRCDS